MKRAARLSLVATLWVGMLGCGDDEPAAPCAPPLVAGEFQGIVRIPGGSLDAFIRATRAPDARDSEGYVEARIQPDGSYVMVVPAGTYTLGLRFGNSSDLAYVHTLGGLAPRSSVPDSFRVDTAGQVYAVDAALGTLHVDVSLPRSGDAVQVSLQLLPRYQTPDVYYPGTSEVPLDNGTAAFTLAGLLPGAYRVQLLLLDSFFSIETLWAPGVPDSSDSPWIDIGTNAVATTAVEVPEPPAAITGRVTGAWMAFGENDRPRISLVNPDSTLAHTMISTDNAGNWTTRLYGARPVKVQVQHIHGPDQWIGGPSFETATLYQLLPGQTTTSADLVESGLEIDLDSERSDVYDLRLQVFDAVTRKPLYSTVVYTNDHNLTLSGFQPGSYLLYTAPENPTAGWLPRWYDGVNSPDAATPIVVGSGGSITSIRLRLESRPTLAAQRR